MKDNHFFAMMARMKYINRWALMRNTYNENICEHSLDVAMIAHALGVIANTYYGESINADRLALMGMFHDSTEIITGDMPTPVKYYNPDIRSAYKEVEKYAGDELLKGLPSEMREVYRPLLNEDDSEALLWRYVKAADKLSAYIKCVQEMRMGNQDFEKAADSTLESIKAMKLDAVDYFLENFMPAYALTLDESR